MKTIFEKSIPGRKGYQLKPFKESPIASVPKEYRRENSVLFPECSELDVIRHFTQLSHLNFSVDANCYPLGSCTMKYNPRIAETIAGLPGFSGLHPLLPQLKGGETLTQGALRVLYEMNQLLCEIVGMDDFTCQPMAGAHGELTGVMIMAAYHRKKKNKKRFIIVPDAAHGTNPASATIAGYEIVSIASDKRGMMDVSELKKHLNSEVAGLMLTHPNTLGILDSNIHEIAQVVHAVDGLMYYDGANLNALLGRCRPGDLGFDIVHVNLHKTFGTPHGGGGPGSGPVGVKSHLSRFLPISRVIERDDHSLALNYDYPDSVGYIASFYGNFSIILRAYVYILLLGKEGLLQSSAHAVLNANYLMCRLKDVYDLPFKERCMHEFVLSGVKQLKSGVRALDIAKYLIDQGIHPPTIYFPLIVKEALMIEPTETETKETLDFLADCLIEAASLAQTNPQIFKDYPRKMPICRPDEVKAAKELKVNFFA